MNAQLKPFPKVAPSQVTCSLVDQLIQRDAFGQRKYGTSMDRKDLSIRDWLQHGVEELLDGAGYLTAAKREIGSLEAQLVQAQAAAREYALFRRIVEQTIDRASRLSGGKLRGESLSSERCYDMGQDEALQLFEQALATYDADALLRQLRRS